MTFARVLGLTSFIFAAALAPAADAATFKVLQSFCGVDACTDGGSPSTLVRDGDGNLYGPVLWGSRIGAGGVFRLAPHGDGWGFKFVHKFCAGGSPCKDGDSEYSGLSADAAGNLYGSTEDGGNAARNGVVFKLTRQQGGGWKYDRLHTFCSKKKCADGAVGDGHIVADAAGNVYGIANAGGAGHGLVFELSPVPRKQDWSEKILYTFCDQRQKCSDGAAPLSGLTFAGEAQGAVYDGASPLFGTTSYQGGAHGQGMVYMLTPTPSGPWTETILYDFCRSSGCPDGANPSEYGPVIVDGQSNVYGTTSAGGADNDGTLFKLVPDKGSWQIFKLYDFCTQTGCTDGGVPHVNPVADAAGRLYGTTDEGGGNGTGTIYKFEEGTMNVLYRFCRDQGCADGNTPRGVVLDQSGNLFGSNNAGGAEGGGTIYEFTP
jgi:uncharacterized repeat protein (TIGR03803 family)